MEFGQHQMQVAVTVAVILGAAVIAMMCDMLRRHNEQLRELTIELKVRGEVRGGASMVAAPEIPAIAPRVNHQHDQPVQNAKPIDKSNDRRPRGRPEGKRTIAPEALAAMERGAQLATSPRPRVMPDRVPVENSTPAVPRENPPPAAKAAEAARDWNQLLSVRRPAPPPRKKKSRATSTLPAGFQDGFVLTRLVESHQPVSGLVVSIGASALKNQDGSVPANVRELIQSLIGPNDFAAQSGSEEFLLIYPNEQGASAQRKLSQISEQLWDFQLRSPGKLSILFSWGGVEVRSESIEEAIASATERMQETRRNRKILTMESKPDTEVPWGRAV